MAISAQASSDLRAPVLFHFMSHMEELEPRPRGRGRGVGALPELSTRRLWPSSTEHSQARGLSTSPSISAPECLGMTKGHWRTVCTHCASRRCSYSTYSLRSPIRSNTASVRVFRLRRQGQGFRMCVGSVRRSSARSGVYRSSTCGDRRVCAGGGFHRTSACG